MVTVTYSLKIWFMLIYGEIIKSDCFAVNTDDFDKFHKILSKIFISRVVFHDFVLS